MIMILQCFRLNYCIRTYFYMYHVFIVFPVQLRPSTRNRGNQAMALWVHKLRKMMETRLGGAIHIVPRPITAQRRPHSTILRKCFMSFWS
jgi:hypothetical protein